MTSEPPTGTKILWLHSHFLLPTGGTKYIYEVACQIADRRPIEMVVNSASTLWRRRYAEAGIPLHETGRLTSTSMVYWALLPWFLRRDLKAVDRLADGSGVLVSSFFPMPWVAGRVARRRAARHVTLCFEPFPFFHDREVVGMYPMPKRLLLGFLRLAYGGLDRAGIRRADSVVTLNAVTRKQIETVYRRPGSILAYAGVDTELFRPYSTEELADLVSRYGPGPWVVHSTDFSPIKRTDLAVRAFAECAKSNDRARLLITSTRTDPSAESQLKRLAGDLGVADRVELAGFLPFEDVPRVYSMATVLLQTGTSVGSGATTMSLPVKEALACGTAVVRSNATDEDVEDGVSGFLVDPTDVVATGARLAALLDDPERSAAMGRAGRARIEQSYSWPVVADVVLKAVGP